MLDQACWCQLDFGFHSFILLQTKAFGLAMGWNSLICRYSTPTWLFHCTSDIHLWKGYWQSVINDFIWAWKSVGNDITAKVTNTAKNNPIHLKILICNLDHLMQQAPGSTRERLMKISQKRQRRVQDTLSKRVMLNSQWRPLPRQLKAACQRSDLNF